MTALHKLRKDLYSGKVVVGRESDSKLIQSIKDDFETNKCHPWVTGQSYRYGKSSKQVINYMKSLEYLIISDIINPNYFVPGKGFLIIDCLREGCGHKEDNFRAQLVFDHTSDNTLLHLNHTQLQDYFEPSDGEVYPIKTLASLITESRLPQPMKLQMIKKLLSIGYDFTKDEGILESVCLDFNFELMSFFTSPEGGSFNINFGFLKIKIQNYRNTIQKILYNCRYCKIPEIWQMIANILQFMLSHGLDLTYVDINGSNILDYILYYGWQTTPVYQVLRNGVCQQINKATGNKPTNYEPSLWVGNFDSNDIANSSSFHQNLLYSTRYVKNEEKIKTIIKEFLSQPRDYTHKNCQGCDLNDYIVKYWSDCKQMRADSEEYRREQQKDYENVYRGKAGY